MDMPNNMAVSDTFNAIAGCDKTISTCIAQVQQCRELSRRALRPRHGQNARHRSHGQRFAARMRIKPYIPRIVAKSALHSPLCRILAVKYGVFDPKMSQQDIGIAVTLSLQFRTSCCKLQGC